MLGVCEKCCTVMNSLNKTESAIFISLFWFGCSRGIEVYRNYFNYVHFPVSLYSGNILKFLLLNVINNLYSLFVRHFE